jgi:acyl-CoA hydrolase
VPHTVHAADWPRLLKAGETVYMPGCSGESPLLREALMAQPQAAAGVTFTGMYIPGVNRFDWASLTPTTRIAGYFYVPDQRASFLAGRVDLHPLSYVESYRHLETQARIDTAILHLSPPDAHGHCSLGLAADFTPAVWTKARRRIAHINPNLPRTQSPTISYHSVDYVIDAPGDLLEYRTPPVTPDIARIAQSIAGLIENGATLQLGLGNIPKAVVSALADKEGLAIHSGMITDPVAQLGAARVTTGVALGTRELYAWVAKAENLRFAPVGFTHATSTLGQIERFTAINSIIEIDLFGQANAEMMGGQLASSPGGLVDFLRGARIAPGGQAIVALKSTAQGGAASRIVPRLGQALVGIARADIDVVVTEQGLARLGGLSVEGRAHALIAIADPAHQPMLQDAWTHVRQSL